MFNPQNPIRREFLRWISVSAAAAASFDLFASERCKSQRDTCSLNDFDNEQSFIDYVCDPNHARVGYFPSGNLNLRDALVIPPGSSRFQFIGLGGATIVQQSNDCPIFLFPDEPSYEFSFDNLAFSWEKIQSDSSKLSYAIALDCKKNISFGFYNFVMSRIRVARGGGIGVVASAATNRVPVWGASFRNWVGGESMKLPLFNLASPGNAGSPNIEITNAYIRRDNCALPSIILKKVSTAILRNIEINKGDGRGIFFESGRNYFIDGLRFENNSINSGSDDMLAVSGPDTLCRIRGLELQAIHINSGSDVAVASAMRGARLAISDFSAVGMSLGLGRLALVRSKDADKIELASLGKFNTPGFNISHDDGTPDRTVFSRNLNLEFSDVFLGGANKELVRRYLISEDCYMSGMQFRTLGATGMNMSVKITVGRKGQEVSKIFPLIDGALYKRLPMLARVSQLTSFYSGLSLGDVVQVSIICDDAERSANVNVVGQLTLAMF